MTAGQFREVDLDLLADFVGGALDGTPDEAEVARLVAEDPAWTQAYAALAPAVDSVRDTLASWGELAAPMPTEVTDRLTAALAAADPVGSPPAEEPAVRRLAAVPTDPADRKRDGERRRRWSRWAGPVAVAAAVVAFAGFGVSRLADHERPKDSATTAAGGSAPEAAGPELAPAAPGAPRALLAPAGAGTVTSGTNYAPGTLSDRAGDAAATRNGKAASATAQPGSGAATPGPEQDRTMANTGLRRLVDRTALGTCLNAIAAEHGRGSLAVDLVDYASFEGAPALVITFADQPGDRWAWVVGPECGVPGSGADTRYQARVG